VMPTVNPDARGRGLRESVLARLFALLLCMGLPMLLSPRELQGRAAAMFARNTLRSVRG
jgi:hypothetical protein